MLKRKIASSGAISIPRSLLTALQAAPGDFLFIAEGDGGVGYLLPGHEGEAAAWKRLEALRPSAPPSPQAVPDHLPPRVWASQVLKSDEKGRVLLPDLFTKLFTRNSEFFIFQLRSWGHMPFITIMPLSMAEKREGQYSLTPEAAAHLFSEAVDLENKLREAQVREAMVAEREKKAQAAITAVRTFLMKNEMLDKLQELKDYLDE